MYMCHLLQDDKTDVVANDAGDRVMPAIVAFTDTEQVMYLYLTSLPDGNQGGKAPSPEAECL